MAPDPQRWFDEAVDALGEVLPDVDVDHPAALAARDRVFAHAEATGQLERVTYPGPVVVCGSDGTSATVERGRSVVLLDRDGRAYLLCCR